MQPLDAQGLHVDVLAVAEPFGVVAKGLHRNGLGCPRDAFLFEKCLKRVYPCSVKVPIRSRAQQPDLSDTFDQMRDGHWHGAIDIMRPESTPVHAVSDGIIRKLFLSKAGGNFTPAIGTPTSVAR
jgi:hypothetical protein